MPVLKRVEVVWTTGAVETFDRVTRLFTTPSGLSYERNGMIFFRFGSIARINVE